MNIALEKNPIIPVFIWQILSADGLTEVGRISKLWSGMLKELLTDADNFGIAFPLDMDVNVKACLLGACLLIVSQKMCNISNAAAGSEHLNGSSAIFQRGKTNDG